MKQLSKFLEYWDLELICHSPIYLHDSRELDTWAAQWRAKINGYIGEFRADTPNNAVNGLIRKIRGTTITIADQFGGEREVVVPADLQEIAQ